MFWPLITPINHLLGSYGIASEGDDRGIASDGTLLCISARGEGRQGRKSESD